MSGSVQVMLDDDLVLHLTKQLRTECPKMLCTCRDSWREIAIVLVTPVRGITVPAGRLLRETISEQSNKLRQDSSNSVLYLLTAFSPASSSK